AQAHLLAELLDGGFVDEHRPAETGEHGSAGKKARREEDDQRDHEEQDRREDDAARGVADHQRAGPNAGGAVGTGAAVRREAAEEGRRPGGPRGNAGPPRRGRQPIEASSRCTWLSPCIQRPSTSAWAMML